MKRFAQRILLLVAAATVFITGMGVTIVNCQCIACDKQPIFMSTQQLCCSSTAQAEQTKACCASQGSCHTTGQTEYSKDKHCAISRVAIDIDASSFRPHVSTPFVWISDALFVQPISVLPDIVEHDDEYIYYKTPPDTPPREYLSFIRVLII
ncbi:hypothetical protein GGR21_003013 [Dysgonomonas hofstadii]|uniref:Uncharacterized protein n=1 Tax=Dysgonomonas hofstadii TaxID=637886 RepID=A0A840CSI2_9BACT|nr:hypothetical protein [Dysgonomonas hofstadii]MBB4037098.1 hypothetical protein [Dysgonomonas hofstadii]